MFVSMFICVGVIHIRRCVLVSHISSSVWVVSLRVFVCVGERERERERKRESREVIVIISGSHIHAAAVVVDVCSCHGEIGRESCGERV